MKGIKRLVRSCLALSILAAAIAGGSVGSAFAYEGPMHLDPEQYAIESFDTSTGSELAGARSDYQNAFEMKWEVDFETGSGEIFGIPYGRPKKFEFDLPPGLVGDPTAIPACPREVFLRFFSFEGCPIDTRVGIATVLAAGASPMEEEPIFNLAPGPDEPALFGMKLGTGLYAYIEVEVSSDGVITAVIDEAPSTNPPYFSDATFFGIADPTPDAGDSGDEESFMSNPTNCVEAFTTHMRSESFEDNFDSAVFSEPPRVGCDEVPFAPSMRVTPTSREAGAPTGLDVNITVPQSEDPDQRATAHVKDVTMTFPEGMTVSASSATGLGSCSPQQFGYHEETPITCPLSSKIGEVEVETHILEEPLKGPVYVAKQNDNPFNSLLALYMAPAGSGVELKLAGKVDLDPATGRLTTTFLNNPQQPFTQLRVKLKDGPRSPLMLPASCGTYATTADLRSWAMPGEAVPLQSSFAVDQGCGEAGRFTPGFSAGTTNPKAGAFSPFTLRLTRPSAAQPNVSRFEATLPEGLLAKLGGVPLCSDAAAAAASCPAASRVGHTTVGVGAGPSPVFAPEPGKAPTALYLGGPHNGGPYSIIAEVPAQAGPFDLGTVVLKNALRVNPRTAQVTAISDPLPQILQGIPISYRDIRVDVDRPGFTINPTDCGAMATTATLFAGSGQSAALSAPFQATQCRALGFKPRLSLRLKGGTKRSAHPALTAVMRARPGDANIGRVSVALPKSEFLAQDHIRTVCTRVQFAADACPKGSVYGYAEATTPLLDQKLAGPVYLRSSDNPLPDLVAALKGPIEIELVGRIDSVNQGIRTTFDVVPDAPVTKFTLRMGGGKKSLLENSRNLCRGKNRATVKMDAQNGRERDFRPVVKATSCGKKTGKKRR